MREVGVAVIAGPGAAAGFDLAGLEVIEADGPDAAARAVRKRAADPDVGVILVQEDLVDNLAGLEKELSPDGGVVLVSFPGPTWAERPGGPREHVARILRRAVGYRVRL